MQMPDPENSFECLILRNGLSSQRFGRRLYHLSQNGTPYWLKFQLSEVQYEYEKGFLHELQIYRRLGKLEPSILLPARIIELNQIAEFSHLKGEGLILPHGDYWLSQPAQQLSFEQVQQKIFAMLGCLQILHQTGWIHGDLKPQHFLYCHNQLTLIDFEQSQPVTQVHKATTLNATPRYMAPELFHGEIKTVRTDLYALGVILYEWLSGKRLSARNYQDWAVLHCQTLKIRLPDVFIPFFPLLNGLLSKYKDQRFQQVNEALYHLKY